MDWNSASEEPLINSRRRGRRPTTFNRTGRRGRLNALVDDSPALVGSSIDFSIRHTQVLREVGGEPIAVLNRLLNTLQESGIPGPQLFRLQSEFSEPLGEGSQGNVRGLNADAAERYQGADESIRKIWPAHRIAIKQHLKRKDDHVYKIPFDEDRFDRNNLSSRFRAAECEVLALAPGLFQNYPNIVRLVGWGLCLDTAEDPTSSCCGGLQLPLLVFERAEMNLAQFLNKVFATSRDDHIGEVCLEEGLGEASYTSRPLSLARHTWHSFRSWIRAEQDVYGDVYGLVRLLCIDVGQGLKSLHGNNFTHGDLKPENILIFREGRGWRAKLCDFGCAIGHDNDVASTSDDIDNNIDADPKTKHRQRRTKYLGTPGWLPSDREIAAIRGFDELRRCDLYVYGLIVWSSFCRQGQPHPGNPILQDMLEEVKQLTVPTKHQLSSTVCKQWIASQVEQVLEDTMKKPQQRTLEPWTLLRQAWWRREQAINIAKTSRRAVGTRVQGSRGKKFQLSLEMKENYHKLAWWLSPTVKPPNGWARNFLHKLAWWLGHDQAPKPARGDYSNNVDGDKGNNNTGPASSVALDTDDNCLSTRLFRTRRRNDDSNNLHSRMLLAVHKLCTNRKNQLYRQNLYNLARFRSRVPIEWWRSPAVARANILEDVLQSVPSVDMHTLAWLCAGSIGRDEVKSLSTQRLTWASMMDSNVLDESERLDRFLLLLQFGAPVASPSPQQSRFQESSIPKEHLDTIFLQFIKSCRTAVMVVVLKQIFQRLGRARKEGLVSNETFYYFDWMRRGNQLQEILHDSLAGTTSKMEGVQEFSKATETLALNSSTDLPPGWKAIEAKENRNKCYKDVFTESVTLTKPWISPIRQRQLSVGFLHERRWLFQLRRPHNEHGTACHVDLLACMRAGSSLKEDSELAQDLGQRFPYYDEAWYVAEWSMDPMGVDVLKTLKNGWGIRTFTSRLRAPGMNVAKTIKSLGVIIIGASLIVFTLVFNYNIVLVLLIGGFLIIWISIMGRV